MARSAFSNAAGCSWRFVAVVVTVCSAIGCGESSDDGKATPADSGALDAGGDVASDVVAPTTNADGSLSNWQTLSPMPHSRSSHCSFVVDGYLIVVGGIHKPDPAGPFVTSDQVHAAKIESDGSLAAWQPVGTTPSGLAQCTGTVDGTTITLAGGDFVDDAHQQRVWSASFQAGSLGTWQQRGSLPTEFFAFGQSAFFLNSRLFVTAFRVPESLDGGISPGSTVLLHADLSAPSPTFAVEEWLPAFRGRATHAQRGDHVYLLGGYVAGNETKPGVERATIGLTGALSDQQSMAPLPEPRNSGKAVVVDDFVFYVGGRELLIGTNRADVYSAAIGADGSVPEWKAQTSLPQGRASMGVSVHGDYIYVTGGGFNGPGTDVVFRAQVRF